MRKVRPMTATGTRWLTNCVWLAACVCLLPTTPVQAQGLPPKVIVWQNPSTTTTGHYAILGEVTRPGTYSSSQEMTLQRLVNAAGGLTTQAVPSVRIIRTERAGQSLYFNPNGQDRLLAGDIVVVDRNLSPAMNGEDPPAVSVVWIGIAGVSQRPVVVPVEPGDAQLPTIMLALGQSQELARSTRVMLPPGSPLLTANHSQMLPNGTVIAVPPGLLVWGRLPEFPEAQVIPDAATPSPPSFASLTTPPSVPVPVPVSPSTEPPAAATTEPYRTPFDQELSASTVPFSTIPIPETPASPASLPAPGSRLAPAATVAPPPPTIEGPVSVTANLTANLEQQNSSDAADIVGEMTRPPRAISFNYWQMLGIAGTVASLVGGALGTRHYLDRANSPAAVPPLARNSSRISPEMFAAAAERSVSKRPVDAAAELAPMVSRERSIAPEPPKTPALPRESLSDLLQRKTPIEQELADLPVLVHLPGRSVKSEPNYGLDAAHSATMAGPHLPVAQFTPIDLTLEVDAPQEVFLPKPHFIRKLASSTHSAELAEPQTVAAEIPAASELAEAPTALPDDPRFQSPIERALARLQRGRRA